jgi:predicted porin
LGSTYDFSTFKVVAYLQRNHTDLLRDAHGYMAGVSIPLGLGQVRASYLASRNPMGNASQSAVGYTYFLSKRTQLYTTFAHMSNSGLSRIGLWPASQDFGAAGAPAAGQSENGLQLGIRHYF